MNKKKILVYISFMLIMIALGASDSMRGIFSGIFETHFSLNKNQVGMIVTVSYTGNLVFMLFGSRLADSCGKKKVCFAVLSLWMAAILLYLLTDNYFCLLAGMFVSMGASTLMNTLINILSPSFFGLSAGMIVNTLFFTQGIGTSANQNLTGRFAQDYGSFRIVNAILLIFGLLGAVCLLFVRFPKETGSEDISETGGQRARREQKTGIWQIAANPVFSLLVLLFGFYFIAEHGIMNWWLMYLKETMQLSGAAASNYLSLFFGGMTLGRLVFAPFVTKLGCSRSILIFGGIGTALYIAGILGGGATLVLVSLSGLFISILYPTMVLLTGSCFPRERIASATGWVISAATLFDIGFNAVFGQVIDTLGFSLGILSFPVCMAAFYGLFLLLRHKTKQGTGTGGRTARA